MTRLYTTTTTTTTNNNNKLMTMHEALYPRVDVDRLCVARKEGIRGLTSIQDSVGASIQRLEDYIKKFSHQKQYRQHKHQQNENNKKTKLGRKTTAWTFQATNKPHLTRGNLDMAKNGKP